MKKTVNVEIMGQTFTVSSDAEEGYVRKVAEYVDGKIREVLKTGRPVAKSSVAMLAALNIADEYYRLKESYDGIASRLSRLSKRLSTTLTEEG
ncbi:MAG: cell division protein ZapA [Deltaproteobacteria bacterium]|nr:cell division protein ZapA [Deltaproteobacteria bacterium]